MPVQGERRVNDPLGFQALYQQRPAGAGARMFRREWLEGTNLNCRYDPVRHPPNHRAMNKVMLVDPANSKSQSADYTSIWLLGLAADRNFYVLDMVRDRLSLTERGDAVLGLHRKWQLARGRSIVGYENYGLQADVSYLNDRMARENYRFPIKEIGGRLNKAGSDRAAGGAIRAGANPASAGTSSNQHGRGRRGHGAHLHRRGIRQLPGW